jgi:hypothetical protein
MTDFQQELSKLETQIDADITALEEQQASIRVQLERKRRDKAAVKQLRTDSNEGDAGTTAKAARPNGRTPGDSGAMAEAEVEDSELEFTHPSEYWIPILKTLVELGGRSRREKVIQMVGEKMSGILKPADYGRLPGTGHTRWKNRVAWQASNMRTIHAYIKQGSPRGVWEITPAGREWLKDNQL